MAYPHPGRHRVGPGREWDQDLPTPTTAQTPAAVRDVVALAWQADRRRLAGAAGFHLLSAVAGLGQVRDTGDVVSLLVRDRRVPVWRVAVLAGTSAVAYGGPKMASAVILQLDEAVTRRVVDGVLDAVAELELADLEDPLLLDGLEISLNQAPRAAMHLLSTALSWPQVAFGLVGGVAELGAADAPLAALSLAGAGAKRLLERSRWGRMRGAWARETRRMMGVRHQLTDAQSGKELLAFGSASALRAFHDRLADEDDAVRLANRRRGLVGGVLDDVIGAASSAPSLIRVGVGALRGEASISTGVSAGLSGRQLSRALQRLPGRGGSARQSAAMWREHQSFLARAKARSDARPTGTLPAGDFARIGLCHVDFSYPGQAEPVLRGVDLEVTRGEVVALVGENGSGKTTLAKILCGLYRPSAGSVEWNGDDISGADPRALRRHLAVVFQDFARFPFLTAAQNIAVGRTESWDDMDAIRDAARQAGAEEAILALPNGYDTIMSRTYGGSDLSVGQWQRVALARAFLRAAPLVVLDEPTSALDPRAERALFETVASLYAERAALLISHRLSSVRFADRISVLAGGQITESGTHDELIALGGTYAELFELQAHSYR